MDADLQPTGTLAVFGGRNGTAIDVVFRDGNSIVWFGLALGRGFHFARLELERFSGNGRRLLGFEAIYRFDIALLPGGLGG